MGGQYSGALIPEYLNWWLVLKKMVWPGWGGVGAAIGPKIIDRKSVYAAKIFHHPVGRSIVGDNTFKQYLWKVNLWGQQFQALSADGQFSGPSNYNRYWWDVNTWGSNYRLFQRKGPIICDNCYKHLDERPIFGGSIIPRIYDGKSPFGANNYKH